MISKISEEELQFCEHLFTPISFIENIVPTSHDAPETWKNENQECIRIRLYQIPMLSYEYLVANDPNKTEQENFDLKKGAGQLYSIGGRLFGKSFCSLFCDALLTIIHYTSCTVGLASFDFKHLRKIMEDICSYVETHAFFKIFHVKGSMNAVARSPYRIQTRRGLKFVGINENVADKNPGKEYHQYHMVKRMVEEVSYMSEEGNKKAIHAVAEIGCIERFSGIPDITDESYIGRVLDDPKKRGEVVLLPQYVRHTWNEEQKQRAVDEYNGEGNPDYLLNVEGQRLEGAFGILDLKKLKECYNYKKEIKSFEISKKDIEGKEEDVASVCEEKIFIDKIPSNQKYICADIGDNNAPTEIIILYKAHEKYVYAYNIVLNRLTDDEQQQVFKWLYNKVNGAFIGLDCSDGTGRSIIRELAKTIEADHLVMVQFSTNITVGFEEKDGEIVRDKDNKEKLKKENTMDWADKQLAQLIYKKQFELYLDDKVYKQFSSYKMVNGKRRAAKQDHLLQAFQVFAIAQWIKESDTAEAKSAITGTIAI